MRVDKDGAMDASAGERSTRVEPGDEAEAEIVELTPRADDADRHPELRPIPKGDVSGETVLVIPYTISAGEPALLVPTQEDTVLGMATAAGGCVEAAERAVRAALPNSGGVTGFAAGADEDGARLVVVAMEGEPKSVARTAARRPKGILAGAATLWCTLAALTAPSWQSQIASLAVATASHFTTLDGQTSSILQGELGVRDATGLQAGRTEYHAPTRGLATGDSTMTVRDMLKGHAPALKQLVTRLL